MYYEAESYPSPGLPVKDPCLSFWLQNTRSSSLLGHRTTESLPPSVDVVIIGSGLSGAATAYYLLTGLNPPKSVLMLEAREACDGATGRNGGHCRPYVFQGYHEYKKIFGKEEALKIIAFDMANLHLMTELIEKEQIDCDFWLGESYETSLDQEAADKKLDSYQMFKEDGGPIEGVVKMTTDSDEAKRLTRMRNAVLTASFPAASLFPYKLVSHLLQLCISKFGLNLQTHTPVTAVGTSAQTITKADAQWIITTPRGKVMANKVIFATNAYTATLLPEFLGNIVPGQGQCAAIVPTPSYSGKGMMDKTCCYYWGKDHFDYLIQRPKDGIIILGGGKDSSPRPGAILGCTNDSGRTGEGGKQAEITEYFKSAMDKYFGGWHDPNSDQRGDSLRSGEGLLYDWTGIMGFTRDNIPFVGNVEGKPGAYVIAGHCGHGMARIASCAKGLAMLISGASWSDTSLPESFRPTKKRMRQTSQTTKNNEEV
ncbi:FAD dependent oxidoreductase [Lentinula detonsa]|uniref:FAD dependent oxidoreductase n=1 Tax=Lentinula detonsa TaxID=2804962 RepID=A0A9W8NWV0_9AGAR|nr:FAD dependent oxidoreductase [Lentinula detonsa]KAJ3984893.1 FAD dependent oxidoreductase [Lentinula detonsa]